MPDLTKQQDILIPTMSYGMYIHLCTVKIVEMLCCITMILFTKSRGSATYIYRADY